MKYCIPRCRECALRAAYDRRAARDNDRNRMNIFFSGNLDLIHVSCAFIS